MCLNLKHYTFKIRRHSYSSTCMNHMVTTNQKLTRGIHKLERKELKHTAKKKSSNHKFSSVQSLIRVWLFVIPWTAACQASLSIINPRVFQNPCPSSQWWHLTISSSVIPFSSCPQSLLASGSFPMSQLFASSGQSIGVSASISVLPTKGDPGLISFRMDWLDLLAVQGTLKSFLQHHSSKASILWCSAIFIVQLSHPYMTTGKTIALTRWTFVGKVMYLLLNMLSWLVITFFPRSKHLLISWLQSPSAVILEPPKINSATISTVSPSICHEVMGLDAMILVFWIEL